MNKTAIICLDCGTGVEGIGTPKEVAKAHKWYHVTKGKWRCPGCQSFQNAMDAQFGAKADVIVPSRG